MKTLFQKSLVTTGLVTAALALAGNAMAANVHANTRATAAHAAYADCAAIASYPVHFPTAASAFRSGAWNDGAARSSYYPFGFGQNLAVGPGMDVRQLIRAVLGNLPPPYAGIVRNAMRASGSHRYSGSSGSPGVYDSGPSSGPSMDPTPSSA